MQSPETLGAGLIHHDLKVTIVPATHRLTVEDTITLPSDMIESGGTVRFSLHRGLAPRAASPGAQIRAVEGAATSSQYTLRLPPGTRQVALRYGGEIHHPIAVQAGDQARGTGETLGTISEQGVFLSATGQWYPQFGDRLVSFSMEISLPPGWTAVSQGQRTLNERSSDRVRVRWEEAQPQPEIYLLAGRYTEYERASATPATLAFLLEPDQELANQYLDATVTYIDFFSRLIGPYPYRKFALVENFWETGYGMPSFTALGRTVIRLPFIIQSSYPHEILHNWWGNGVYVDIEHGNWSEGLTAYLADHLLAEQRGQGAAMRRNNLQRYADYVHEAADFPLIEFRARHSPATEAVGYGKAMMLFHMLRRELGDAAFLAGLRDFYREELFKVASFDDLRQALARHAGSDLRAEFEQWTTRVGAPQLTVSDARTRSLRDRGFELKFVLEQVQSEAPYVLQVPVAVTLDGAAQAYETTVPLGRAREEISLQTSARPLRIDIDPQFDLFRRVDRREVPPAFSQAFGAQRTLIVLPSAAVPEMRKAYRALAEGWRSQLETSSFDIVEDAQLKALPDDRSVWLFGWENLFAPDMRKALPATVQMDDGAMRLPEYSAPRADHAVALTTRRPGNIDLALTWVAAAGAEMLANVGRKLPHYGQYSYAAFKGEAAVNVAKGQWPVTDSPLAIAVRQADGSAVMVPPAALAPRTALAP